MTNEIHKDPKILKLQDVISLTGLSRSQIYVLKAKREFPDAIKLGSRSVGWLKSEIDSWLSFRVADRDAKLNRQTNLNQLAGIAEL